jgi:hypothetical protein
VGRPVGVRHFPGTRNFFFYLWMIGEMFVLFLIAAVSLPDEPGSHCDLRAHYANNRRYFWTLVALFQFTYLVNGIYFIGIDDLSHLSGHAALQLANNMALPLVVALVLRRVHTRAVHYLGVGLLLASTAWHYSSYQIN